MASAVGPRLGHEGLCFVHHYPASQAALARLDPLDPRVALRFELYYRGVELANGFEELADAAEQRARFELDRRERQAAGCRPRTSMRHCWRRSQPDCRRCRAWRWDLIGC